MRGIAKSYGGVTVLHGLDLLVESGELMVLLGASGSGKSTALRVLAGLETASAGSVHIGGRDVTGLAPHRRDVAMVFQDYALYPHLSVADNLAFPLRSQRLSRSALHQRTRQAADALGLAALLDRFPDQLSGGQQQRVALARAMVREPTVYLLDEPVSNLDAGLRLQAREQILELQRSLGSTTVYVTHDQTEAMAIGDRLTVLHEGRVAQTGSPQQVYDEPASEFVAGFLGSPPMNLVDGARATGQLLGGRAGTTVGVRPEDLALVDGDDASRVTVPGTVLAVEALGSEAVVTVHCGDGDRLFVRTPPRPSERPGDLVQLVVAPGRTHHFDATTGRRRA